MRDLGLPKGIGDQLIASTRDFAMRYWIIDNSGSMKAQSGHRVVRGAGGREGMVACSRWEELGEGIKWHAAMAAHLHAPTEFRLLNAPSGFAGKTARLLGVRSFQCFVLNRASSRSPAATATATRRWNWSTA